MKRIALLGVLLLGMTGHARGQVVVGGVTFVTINGVVFGPSALLAEHGPGGSTRAIPMTWNPAGNRYEGEKDGMTYWVDLSGPDNGWAVTLGLPAIRANGTVSQYHFGPGQAAAVQWDGTVPTSGPFWNFYGIVPFPQPDVSLTFVLMPT